MTEQPKEPIHIISLGAGVQSSCMALMAAKGEIGPMPLFAVFADTQDEPEDVYKWLSKLSKLLPFPVYTVTKGRLSDPENLLAYGHSQIPCFMRNDKGQVTLGKRQCTAHYKIRPVNKAIRVNTGTVRKRLAPGSFIVWQGISWDEMTRMKESREPHITNRFPLIELRMSRERCKLWMLQNGYDEPPKSSCLYCPYKGDEQWKESKRKGGSGWRKIVSVDRLLNARGEFLHPSCLPIDQVDFSKPRPVNMQFTFNDECDGMCGV